ncbi:hypothetical protein [Teredinibacter purpureus]|uniref:hypothetical protein n=1 Tax=Teredinibacter purpureus TaxID=2731756 RepID=UPI0005F85847|nr:hypothetical protein [Teredinibacter purpureus]
MQLMDRMMSVRMNKNELTQLVLVEVSAILASYNIDRDVTVASRLGSDLEANSLMVILMLSRLEATFEDDLPDEIYELSPDCQLSEIIEILAAENA